MTDYCNSCGQPLHGYHASRVIQDEDELLRLLSEEPGRSCYRTADGRWRYTNDRDSRHVISGDLIKKLVRAGKLRKRYSNTDQSYWVGGTIDVEATMAARRRRGDSPIVYASQPLPPL